VSGRLAPALLFLLVLVAAAPAAQAAGPQFEVSPAWPTVDQPVHFAVVAPTGLAYTWAFGDNGNATGPNATHSYAAVGVYHVTLTATDSSGAKTNVTRDVIVHAVQTAAAAPQELFPTFLYWLMPFIVGAILLSLALVVLIRGQPAIYNRVFFFLYAASALKSLSEAIFFFMRLQLGLPDVDLLSVVRVNYFIAFLYPHLFLWFVFVFPRPLRPSLKNGWRGSTILLLTIPFLVLQFVMHVSDATVHNIFNGYVSVIALLSLSLLVYHAWETDSREERNRIQLLSLTFFLLVFSTIIIAGLEFLHQKALAEAAGVIFTPILEIVGCFVLMYAILKYQLMGVEVFVKKATRYTLFALAIGSVFVIVSNTIEQLVQDAFLGGVQLNFIIAGFIATAFMLPMQKLTERVAKRIFPDADNTAPDHLASRRMEIYEAQLRYAMLDGMLKEKELSMLSGLRDSLGIGADELRAVAKRVPGVNIAVLLAGAPAARRA
jgi:PKD repeat protein